MPQTYENDVKSLVFTELGAVELLDENGRQVWASDDDDDFSDEFGDEFLSEEDAPDVVDFLIEHELMEDDEEYEIREVTLAEATGEHEALDIDEVDEDDDDDDD